jgi:outer membrane protein assembly factor BamB
MAAQPWPSFRGDMQHTGRTNHTSYLRPVLNWAEPTSGSIAGSPVMNSTGTIFVASGSGHVYAYDRDGTRLWTFPTQGAIFGSPTIGPNGTIYVGDVTGRVYAILPGGSEHWTYTITNGGRDARILQAPGVGADGRMYVCSWDGGVHCFTPDGTRQWVHDFGGYVSASPAVDSAGTIYVVGYNSGDGDNLRVRAINPDNTTKWTKDDRDMGSWNYQKQTYIKSSVCVDEARGHLYVGANCPIGGYLWCLNLTDGSEVRWTSFNHSIYSAPAVDPSGIVYFGALDGRLYAYDAATGIEQWHFQTDGLFILGSPLVDGNGYVYVGATDGCLYKVASGGTEMWRFATNNDVRSTPLIDENGVIYFGSMDSRLYSIGGPSAVTHWQDY